MFNTIFEAGAVGAGAASRYGSGSDQMMRLLVAPAPQHCKTLSVEVKEKKKSVYFQIRSMFGKLIMILVQIFKPFLKPISVFKCRYVP
jgi:hypothetical protein